MDTELGWASRARKVFGKVDTTLLSYRASRDRARLMHNTLSVAIIVGAVLAPSLTTLSANAAPHGISSAAIQILAVVVGLTIAIAEALRRLWRPETRWKSTAIAIQDIVAAREAFRDAAVTLDVGSREWIEAFTTYRKAYEAILRKETADFFPDEPDKGQPPT